MSVLTRSLTIGTRGSALARWQTEWVRARLQTAWPDLECQTPKVFTGTTIVFFRVASGDP